MLYNLLASTATDGMSKWGWGVFTFILGMVVVFLGMALLVLFVSGVAKLFSAKKKENKGDDEESEQEEVMQTSLPDVDDGDIPENVKAAIIAAVIAYYQGEDKKHEFVVRKIKKLNN